MKILNIFILVFFSFNCYAVTGNDLYKMFQSEDTRYMADMYILGFRDSMVLHKGVEDVLAEHQNRKAYVTLYICIPENTINQQSIDIVKSFIYNHPERRQENAGQLIFDSLIDVWRCLPK